MGPQGMQRRLAAILSADVQGYSRLMGQDELATVQTITAYREMVAGLIASHRGRVVDMPGDNILAEFASAVEAVECSAEIQRQLAARNLELPPDRRMLFRIGINVGDVIADGERIYGDGVNIAARLESLAQGGGICISGTVFDQIETKVDLECAFLGQQRVKNITQPIRVYQVILGVQAQPEPKTDDRSAPEPTAAGKETAGQTPERREPHSVIKETLTFFKDQFKEHLTEAQSGGGRHTKEGRSERRLRSGLSLSESLSEANRLIRQTTQKTNRQARRLYQRALELEPGSAEALTGLGWTHFVEWPYGWSRSGESLTQAGELARKALKLKPDLFLAQLLLAWVHLWQRDYVLALAQGTKLLDREPDNADALAFMAYALAMSGLSAKAGGLLERAVGHQPNYPLFHSFYLGVVFFHLGRLQDAETALGLALQRQPNFLVARVVRSMVYVEQGRTREAKDEVKTIQKLAPDYSLDLALQRFPHKDPADLLRCQENLRRAGLR